jgi:hypothetical protein
MAERVFIWPPSRELGIPSSYVGVVVYRLSEAWIHAGVLYRTAQSNAWVLHLWGHYDLKRQEPNPGQLCILCPIEPLRVTALATIFNRLFRTHREKGRGIPYGFTSPSFDLFAKSEDLKPGLGLCCTSFVLRAYLTAGVTLIEPIDPQPRTDDATWQREVLKEWEHKIEASSDPRTKPHFEEVLKAAGTPLYRPLEVGGSAMADELPCDCETALRNANDLKVKMFEEAPMYEI